MIITGIDLGSYSFKMALCEETAEGLELICLKEIAADGLKKGAIVNMEKVVTALDKLIYSVTEETGITIKECYVAYSSEKLEAFNSDGVMAIDLRGKGRAITQEDKELVVKQSEAIPISDDKVIAHTIPLQFAVDNNEQVKDPINMVAVRLRAMSHIIIANGTLLNNIYSAIKRCGLMPLALVYSPLAAAGVILSSGERENGTLFIDIGGANTKLSFYQHGNCYFNYTLPIGGITLTGDLAYMLKISFELAENLKIKHGFCYKPLLEREDFVYLPGNADSNPRSVSEHYICDILTARMSEIYSVAKEVMHNKGWLAYTNSLVIGGGGNELPGSAELASKIFDKAARNGYVSGLEKLASNERGSSYGSVLGLCKKNIMTNIDKPIEKKEILGHNKKTGSTPLKSDSFNLVKWVKDFF
ncbi:MAG: cell division protein FtsA [Spirochaetaceae bacterium]|nr:cell division protein FtsA [Spirochaetaceae bacterium]